MVSLLEEIATDTNYQVDEDNPLRQVIINSHSPKVVSTVSDESLYLAYEREMYIEKFEKKVKYTGFSALPATWKTVNKLVPETSKGDIISYLEYNSMQSGYPNQVVAEPNSLYKKSISKNSRNKRTVIENVSQTKLDFYYE